MQSINLSTFSAIKKIKILSYNFRDLITNVEILRAFNAMSFIFLQSLNQVKIGGQAAFVFDFDELVEQVGPVAAGL